MEPDRTGCCIFYSFLKIFIPNEDQIVQITKKKQNKKTKKTKKNINFILRKGHSPPTFFFARTLRKNLNLSDLQSA